MMIEWCNIFAMHSTEKITIQKIQRTSNKMNKIQINNTKEKLGYKLAIHRWM